MLNSDMETGARPKKITRTQERVKRGASNPTNGTPNSPKKVQENQRSNDQSVSPQRHLPTESNDSTSTGNKQFCNERL